MNIWKRKTSEKIYPALYRYWANIPGKGEISIFDKSYYYNLMRKFNVSGDFIKNQLDIIYNFEKDLVKDSTIILKFSLIFQRMNKRRELRIT